jgi:hypothetical protein
MCQECAACSEKVGIQPGFAINFQKGDRTHPQANAIAFHHPQITTSSVVPGESVPGSISG